MSCCPQILLRYSFSITVKQTDTKLTSLLFEDVFTKFKVMFKNLFAKFWKTYMYILSTQNLNKCLKTKKCFDLFETCFLNFEEGMLTQCLKR